MLKQIFLLSTTFLGAGYRWQNLDPKSFLLSSWPGGVISLSVVINPLYKCAEYFPARPSYPCLRTLGDTHTEAAAPAPASHDPVCCKTPLLPLSATSNSF